MDQDDEINQEVPASIDSSLKDSATKLNSRLSSLGSAGRPHHIPLCSHLNSFFDKQNWQANYRSIRERNAVLLNNELMSDVYFKVGTQTNVVRIPAHKHILAVGSSVFYAMFYGMLAERTKDGEDIEIPDVDPTAFIGLLKLVDL